MGQNPTNKQIRYTKLKLFRDLLENVNGLSWFLHLLLIFDEFHDFLRLLSRQKKNEFVTILHVWSNESIIILKNLCCHPHARNLFQYMSYTINQHKLQSNGHTSTHTVRYQKQIQYKQHDMIYLKIFVAKCKTNYSIKRIHIFAESRFDSSKKQFIKKLASQLQEKQIL